jgi:hypothetical protein
MQDNPCRHPVLILNDIHVDVLEALMTYMYQGTVAVPQSKLKVSKEEGANLKSHYKYIKLYEEVILCKGFS